MDLISVIVPIYKVEKYLATCVESIINQTYKNLEIILVDDGSPDNCGKICDEYAKKDNRIKVIHKENGGLSSARNAGLNIATGEYISFIDSDDYVAENFMEKLYNLCIENDADIAECDFLRFEKEVIKEQAEGETNVLNSEQMQLRLYSSNYVRTVIVCNKLYKRYVYENIRFPEGKINEDEYTTYKVLWNCKRNVAVTDEELYYYRCNPRSIMGKTFGERRLEVFAAYEERNLFYKDKSEEIYSKSLISYGKRLKEYYWLTSKYIKEPKEHLMSILNKSKNNYSEMLRVSSITFADRMKIKIFILMPKVYCVFLEIINFNRK